LSKFESDTCTSLNYRDTVEELVVNNTTLYNVHKSHYFIASLKNEAKYFISILQITNEKFLVVGKLLTKRYNTKRLIAMTQAKYLFQMPQVRKGDASLFRYLNIHVSYHMNSLQALSLNVLVEDLMLNNLMLATLVPKTQRKRKLITNSCTIPESRCKALELLHTTPSPKVFPTISCSTQSTANNVCQPYSNAATQLKCSFCNGSHRMFKCDKYLKMQISKALITPSNQEIVSTDGNHLLGITHFRSKYVFSVTRAIINLLHIDRQNQSIIDKGSAINGAPADVRGNSNHIVHSRANSEIILYLPQALWKFRINLFDMFHAGYC